MQIENIDEKTYKIIFYRNELVAMGVSHMKITGNPQLVGVLVDKVVEELHDNHDIEVEGPISVQVTLIKGSGNIEMIITLEEHDEFGLYDDFEFEFESGFEPINEGEDDLVETDDFHTDFQEVQNQEPTHKATPRVDMLFQFQDIEDAIQISHRLQDRNIKDSVLLYHDKTYYLSLKGINKVDEYHLNVKAIVSEYGQQVSDSKEFVNVYAKTIIKEKAVEELVTNFKL